MLVGSLGSLPLRLVSYRARSEQLRPIIEWELMLFRSRLC